MIIVAASLRCSLSRVRRKEAHLEVTKAQHLSPRAPQSALAKVPPQSGKNCRPESAQTNHLFMQISSFASSRRTPSCGRRLKSTMRNKLINSNSPRRLFFLASPLDPLRLLRAASVTADSGGLVNFPLVTKGFSIKKATLSWLKSTSNPLVFQLLDGTSTFFKRAQKKKSFAGRAQVAYKWRRLRALRM